MHNCTDKLPSPCAFPVPDTMVAGNRFRPASLGIGLGLDGFQRREGLVERVGRCWSDVCLGELGGLNAINTFQMSTVVTMEHLRRLPFRHGPWPLDPL